MWCLAVERHYRALGFKFADARDMRSRKLPRLRRALIDLELRYHLLLCVCDS